MNNTTISIPKYNIISPNLNDTNYASNLSKVFDNINENFIQLANRDFVKGEQGSNISIESKKFTDKINETTTFEDILIQSLQNKYGSDFETISKSIVLENGNTISLFDNFNKEKNSEVLQIIYNTESNGISTNKKPISSLYYVFLDGRFANNSLSNIDFNTNTNIKDLSCILVYGINENGEPEFRILENAFPTLYYDSSKGLCWKINGKKTGLIAQGVPGKDAENIKLYIVKVNSYNESNNDIVNTTVDEIFDNDSYKNISEIIQAYPETFKNGFTSSALILSKNSSLDTYYKLYFGTITYNNDNINAIFDRNTSLDMHIQEDIYTQVFINTLKKIDIDSNLPGLFIPFNKFNENPVQKVHLLSAIKSYDEDNENTNVSLSPVTINNENKLITDLKSDKYIEFKLSESEINSLFNYIIDYKENYNNSDNKENFNFETIRSSYKELKNNDYTLKYKLINNINKSEINTINNDIKIFTNIVSNTTTPEELKQKIVFVNNDELKTFTDISIPDSFTNNPNGLYKWELIYPEIAEIAEIEAEIAETDNLYNKFIECFKIIYTKSLLPINDEILWFNGISLDFNSSFSYSENDFNDNINMEEMPGTVNPDINNDYSNKYILYGWNYDSSALFNFIKYSTEADETVELNSQLNINYDVNIGDSNNNKNVAVQGNINSNNIFVNNTISSNQKIVINDNNYIVGIKLIDNESIKEPVLFYKSKYDSGETYILLKDIKEVINYVKSTKNN